MSPGAVPRVWGMIVAPSGTSAWSRLLSGMSRPREWNIAPATLAIAWVLAMRPDIVPIPGTRSGAHLAECAAAAEIALSPEQMAELERLLPVGFAAGSRYSVQQWVGVETY